MSLPSSRLEHFSFPESSVALHNRSGCEKLAGEHMSRIDVERLARPFNRAVVTSVSLGAFADSSTSMALGMTLDGVFVRSPGFADFPSAMALDMALDVIASNDVFRAPLEAQIAAWLRQ